MSAKKTAKSPLTLPLKATLLDTKPATIMIVLTSEGELHNVFTLAFHEPPEYQPPEQRYQKLIKKPLADMG